MTQCREGTFAVVKVDITVGKSPRDKTTEAKEPRKFIGGPWDGDDGDDGDDNIKKVMYYVIGPRSETALVN
ncbi:Hypothetical protein CINCED_3A013717 [Cinara cedri]|uniref:Uncharacterized protein n=1 Tax=Cinara cedri TaxID=506608 RepID=A0A5E4M582_9HEMI|nr:Hypothetical protein CINCED_3A013717 [Cinara cedri]